MIGLAWTISNMIGGNAEADEAAKDCIKEGGYTYCREVCDRPGIDEKDCVSKLLNAYDELYPGRT